MEHESLATIAQQYREEGYDVVVEPREAEIPAFIAGFKPDIIVTGGADRIIVEVKKNRTDLSNDPDVSRLAEVVNAEPGWRLDVVVLEPETMLEKSAKEAFEPSDTELAQILRAAEDLADQGYASYAYVVAWGGLEAAMRRIQKGAELYGKSTPTELMRTLYGNGFLNKEQFDRLKETYIIRSQVVHGLVPTRVDPSQVRYMTATARSLACDPEEAMPTS
jgi:uncharacterized protein YutE (UPF0331/DUF86 family)